MMLDLHRLSLLRELHARGTVAAVADALAYSPSTVSHQLAELQREAGVRLFERDGRRLRLTDAARVLVRHAETMLGQMERAEAEMAAAAGAVAGTVRVAAFQTAVTALVAPALPGLAERFPDLNVQVTEAEAALALESLRRRECDLALYDEAVRAGGGAEPRLAGLVYEEVLTEPVRLVVPRTSADGTGTGTGTGTRTGTRTGTGTGTGTGVEQVAGGMTAALAGLRHAVWAAGHPGSSHEALVLAACAEAGGFVPDIRHRAIDLLALLSLVATGQAVTLLPGLARPERDPGVQVRDIGLTRRIVAVTRTDTKTRPALAAVRAALHAEAAAPTTPDGSP